MKINIKKLSIPTVLFLLLSTSYAAEDGYYVPIHNLTPIIYNPLTTNYNPEYDNYPGLMATQGQRTNQAVSGTAPANAKSSQIAEIQSQISELKRQRNLPKNDAFAVPMTEAFTAASRAKQLNTEIQDLEDRLTTIMTGQAPLRVRVVNQASLQRSINCYSYGIGQTFTSCN